MACIPNQRRVALAPHDEPAHGMAILDGLGHVARLAMRLSVQRSGPSLPVAPWSWLERGLDRAGAIGSRLRCRRPSRMGGLSCASVAGAPMPVMPIGPGWPMVVCLCAG